MSSAAKTVKCEVPPEEVARRLAEMRRLAWEHQQWPVVVYHTTMQTCPWNSWGCDYRIAGMTVPLDQMDGYSEESERWLAAWWLGPGLLAKCPGCRRWVLFDVLGKLAVPDPAQLYVRLPQLPDNWHEIAHLAPCPPVHPTIIV